ncbi:MAG: TIGR00341 family protein [Planctomycetota bacterium]
MRERKLEILVDDHRLEAVQELLTESEFPFRLHKNEDNSCLFTTVLSASDVEALTDEIQNRLPGDGYQLVVLPVEVAIPAIPDKAPSPESSHKRISREELKAEFADSSRISVNYLSMVVLSTLVAAIGLHRDNVAVIIGAMVIAPLLGPQMALGLGVTLGDLKLLRGALRTSFAGLFLAFVVAVLAGLLWPLDPESAEVQSRIARPSLADVALALAAGSAGALAFAGGVQASLVGVMVAVALLPPLVVLADMLVLERADDAATAALGLFANVIGINLAAVAVFTLQSVRPRTPFELRLSAKMLKRALFVWLTLLAAYVAILASFGT